MLTAAPWLFAASWAKAPKNSPPVQGTATLPHDLSPWGMFLNADIVVKVVMVGLVFASLVTWTVWLAKTTANFGRPPAALARRSSVLNEARTLGRGASAPRRLHDPVARLVRTADQRGAAVDTTPIPAALKERISWLLERVEVAASRRIGRGMGVLATHRRDRAVRRPVRHGLGHHEQLHRHLERAHHQSRGGRARHRRGAACHRARPVRRDPGGGDLQRVRAFDRRLSRAARRRLGAGDAPGQPRLRAAPSRPD